MNSVSESLGNSTWGTTGGVGVLGGQEAEVRKKKYRKKMARIFTNVMKNINPQFPKAQQNLRTRGMKKTTLKHVCHSQNTGKQL